MHWNECESSAVVSIEKKLTNMCCNYNWEGEVQVELNSGNKIIITDLLS